ncbi:MAG TPA: hypothetical protein VMT22_05315 [Terriglobales bacterium]|nr:hypothetical protein [Terriglobales bacterium]
MTSYKQADKNPYLPAARQRLLFLTMLTLACLSCADSVRHDQGLAARRALEFARVAFIDKNLTQAYEMLSDSGKRHVPLDKFKQAIASMHPRGYPTKLTAVEYEPMPGENAIYIFLKGQNLEEQFTYRVTLEGSADTDYRVLKIDQGSGFPTLSNQKRSFENPPSVP